jgi:hypothetical protein
MINPSGFTQGLRADDSQPQNSQAEDLQHKLRQRDQVILELLERVEALEKQLGVQPYPPNRTVKPDIEPEIDKQRTNKPEQDKTERGPGLVVVDESVAERALERSLTRAGVLLLPSGVFEIEPSFVYSRQEDATPSFVMSGSGIVASETERNSDSLSASLLFRLGLPGDSQLEIGLPYRWRRNETVTNVNFSPTQSSSQSGNGLGDLQITLAKTLLRESTGQPDVIGRLTWDTDSGDISDDGVALGGGYNEVQGSLSFIKRQDPLVFVGGFSYEYSFKEGTIQPGETLAANLGSYIALNPQTSLNFALAMAYQKETRIAGSRLEGSERTIAAFVIGGSTLVGRGSLLNLSLGVGLTDDASDFSASLSLPMRF